MPEPSIVGPEHTAVRGALWRALHVQADPPPHVFEDEIGSAWWRPKTAGRQHGDRRTGCPRTLRPASAARMNRIFDSDDPL
jgi:hypothetical protein